MTSSGGGGGGVKFERLETNERRFVLPLPGSDEIDPNTLHVVLYYAPYVVGGAANGRVSIQTNDMKRVVPITCTYEAVPRTMIVQFTKPQLDDGDGGAAVLYGLQLVHLHAEPNGQDVVYGISAIDS